MTREIPAFVFIAVRRRARKWAWRARAARFLDSDDFTQEALMRLWVSYYGQGRIPSAGEIAVVVWRAATDLVPTRRVYRNGCRVREFYWPESVVEREELGRSPQESDSPDNPAWAVERRERIKQVCAWYEALDPREQSVIAAFLAGRSARDIAADLGLVESRVSQIRSRLFGEIAAL